jgi:hypothetical protein
MAINSVAANKGRIAKDVNSGTVGVGVGFVLSTKNVIGVED